MNNDDSLRKLLEWRIYHLVAAAYRAHQAGLNPISGYCASLGQLVYAGGQWTEEQRYAYAELMRGALVSGWDPRSRDAINWLYLQVSGHQRAKWDQYSVEELERIVSELED